MSDERTLTRAEAAPLTTTTINFHGDELQALEFEGRVWVALRPLCEALGLSYGSQYNRLTDPEKSAWATVFIWKTVAQDKKQRELVMIDRDTLASWLASIKAGKVREDVRPKLVQYQREAARVLGEHFGNKQAESVKEDHVIAAAKDSLKMWQLVIESRQAQLALEAKQQELASQIECVAHTAQAALDTARGNYGKYTVLGYLKLQGREVSYSEASQHGKQLSAICRQRNITLDKMRDPRFGEVNLYPEELLRDYFRQLLNRGSGAVEVN